MSADYTVHGDTAVIVLNNPPVNGMGLATRTSAVAGLLRAQADPAIRAVVVAGAGGVFSGGADIREFNTPQVFAEPTLDTFIRTAETLSKPVVAAIHGVCMGGGLEFSLGCHYRVALPGARIALPEVKLGLLPGAGGTQRLPRAIGLAAALDMIVSGDPVSAEKLGPLFDAVLAPGTDIVAGAVAFAQRVADVRPLPRVRERAVPVAGGADARALLDAARARVGTGPASGAPRACIEALAAAVALPFDDGIAFERRQFLALAQTVESQALRHAFFAERAASKVAGLAPGTPARPVRSAAVVGAGTMGSGIATAFINAGIPVVLLDTDQGALDRGLAAIRRNVDSAVAKGRLAADAAGERLALVRGALALDAAAQADIVVEAVFEDLAVKEDLFRRLGAVMKPGAILATNTSTLDVNRIAAATARPQDVVGLHFFSPAHVMKLLEVVRADATAPDVLAGALALARTLKKTAVVARVCDGFIGNRMLEPYLRQAAYLLDEGALPEQVDRAIEAFGFAMGPFRMSDLAGNDIGWAIRRRRAAADPAVRQPRLPDLLCEAGRFGQKTGAGWYDYAPGARAALPSPFVRAMIERHAASLGTARRAIDDAEIVERLVYALVNEGARILEEGVAQRASDIDVVYLAGYGFPAYRGGPMFYADSVGLPEVVAAMRRFAGGYEGAAWTPAPLLLRLAAEGRRFI
jgi:3-hydroxyacyl-CoA dehydrogenase